MIGRKRVSGFDAMGFAAVLSATTAMGVIFSVPAAAQSAEAPSERSFNIAAQPLTEAIIKYGQQSGMQVTANSDLMAGKTSAAVTGSMSPSVALSRLLAGTGLTFRYISATTVELQAAPKAAEGAISLGPVRVEGASGTGTGYSASLTSDAAATEGTGSYTATGVSKTATGLGLTLRETPQSITVVTRQKMDDFNQQTLGDVLVGTPGIAVATPYGDSVRIYARGAEIKNFQTDGNRSGLSSTQSSGAPGSSNFIDDDMAVIDRVEVLKGSAGLLQGDGYPTATINLIRKKPTETFQAIVGANIGSWNNYRGDIDIGGPIVDTGNIRARVVAAYKDAESYQVDVKKRNALFYATMDFDLTPETLLNVGFEYQHRVHEGTSSSIGIRGIDSSGNRQQLTSRSWNAGAPWAGYKQNTRAVFLTLEHKLSEDWSAKLRLNDNISRIPEWLVGRVLYEHRSQAWTVEDINSHTQNASVDLSGTLRLFGRDHDILAGADFMKSNSNAIYYNLYDNNTTDPYSEFTNNTLDNAHYISYGGRYLPRPTGDKVFYRSYGDEVKRYGGFITTRLNISDSLKIIGGARISSYDLRGKYDTSKVTENGVITPYSGIVFDINRSISLYASYASVFQPVTVQDEQGNTLKPQEGVNYEIGSKAQLFDGRFLASATYFWKRWENTYEATGGFTPTGDSAYRNVNGVMEKGFEIEVSGELYPGLQVQGSYVMNSSELDSASESPKHQFKLYPTYRLPGALTGISVGAGIRWQSKRYTSWASNDVVLEQKSYWLFDIMLGYKINSNISAGLNVNNLFDKKYFSGVGAAPGWGSYYTWGAPRSVNANIRYTF